MKKFFYIMIFIIIVVVLNLINQNKTKTTIYIEHNPYDYYMVDFKNKVNLNNFKDVIEKINDYEIKTIYYDNDKVYNYDNYKNFLNYISNNLSVEASVKYTLYGVNINKILIYTTKYNYEKLSNIILNLR